MKGHSTCTSSTWTARLRGDRCNTPIIKHICSCVSVPVEVGGGIRSEESIQAYLDCGVTRVIIGSKAAEDPDFITAMAEKYKNRLAVSIDAKGDVVATRGWVADSQQSVLPFAEFLLSIGIRTMVYTDISRDGMLSGPNMDMMAKLQQLPCIRLIASGGVSSIARTWRLCRTWVSTGPLRVRPCTRARSRWQKYATCKVNKRGLSC